MRSDDDLKVAAIELFVVAPMDSSSPLILGQAYRASGGDTVPAVHLVGLAQTGRGGCHEAAGRLPRWVGRLASNSKVAVLFGDI